MYVTSLAYDNDGKQIVEAVHVEQYSHVNQ